MGDSYRISDISGVLAWFGIAGLGVCSVFLAGSFWVESEIGAAFLLGACYAFLAAAVLVLSYAMYVRNYARNVREGLEDEEQAAAEETPTH